MSVNRVGGAPVLPPTQPTRGASYSPAPSLQSVESGQAYLRKGMEGESVKALQRKLSEAGYSVEADGKFGPKTEAAVRQYQQAHHLKVDGLAGKQTLGALESSFQPSPQKPPSTPSTPTPSVDPTQNGGTGAAGRYEKIALQKHGQEFVDKAKGIAARLGVKPEWLFAVMQNESGMNPAAVNKNGGATGLIQFMPATAKALGTSTEALKNMSATQQLDYVARFYAPFAGKMKTGADMYMATFYPLALSKSPDFVLGSERSPQWAARIAHDNPAFDLNKDGQISKGEFQQYYNKRFPELAS